MTLPWAIATVGLAIAAQLATAQSAGSTCPVSDAQLQSTNFKGIGAYCEVRQVTGRVACDECLCGLSSTLYAQMAQAGVDVASLVRASDTATIQNFFAACQAPLALQLMLTSGLSQTALMQLGACDVSAIPQRCIDTLKSQAAATGATPSTTTPGIAAPAVGATAPAVVLQPAATPASSPQVTAPVVVAQPDMQQPVIPAPQLAAGKAGVSVSLLISVLVAVATAMVAVL